MKWGHMGSHPSSDKVLKKYEFFIPGTQSVCSGSRCSQTGVMEEARGPRVDTREEWTSPGYSGLSGTRALLAALVLSVRAAYSTAAMPVSDGYIREPAALPLRPRYDKC